MLESPADLFVLRDVPTRIQRRTSSDHKMLVVDRLLDRAKAFQGVDGRCAVSMGVKCVA